MRGATTILALAVAAGAALSATSQAQVAGLAAAYGGGGLPVDPPKRGKAVAEALAVALVPDGAALRVRVSIGMPCSNIRGGLSSDDLLLRVPLAADGSFTGVKRVKSDELGSARVKIAGVATPERAAGTVDVRSLKQKQRCRSGERAFVAKPVDTSLPLEMPAGPPVPGALLVGLSTQKSSIPYGFVARINADGTSISHAFGTETARCTGTGSRARRLFTLDFQRSRTRIKLTNGTFKHVMRGRDDSRGARYSYVDRFSVQVTNLGLRTTFESSDRYRVTGIDSRCVTKPNTHRAVPAD